MAANEDQLKALMIGGLGGDAASHAALLKALVPLLRSFHRRRLRDDGEAEDLVQETLIAVHTRRASFDRDRVFTPWVYAVARYKLIDHVRRRRPMTSVEGLEDVLATDGFEAASNARIDIDRLLAELPPKQATAIRRTRLDGLSTAEAAHESRIGESDVKVSVHRGLKALAARILGDGR